MTATTVTIAEVFGALDEGDLALVVAESELGEDGLAELIELLCEVEVPAAELVEWHLASANADAEQELSEVVPLCVAAPRHVGVLRAA
ncbi:hypothetical protein [Saccharopolyspora cebuensis]|uniref:hypothetical protein n=1 Tax=Saccharopolyspora cebuensis TaxID=418759 RepID=UPI0031E53232